MFAILILVLVTAFAGTATATAADTVKWCEPTPRYMRGPKSCYTIPEALPGHDLVHISVGVETGEIEFEFLPSINDEL
jgi:hypothetical protein